jgi:hypothetical protein
VTDSLLEAVETGPADDRFLIALDIDGTVLLEDETLSPGVADAVSAAVGAGHIVTIATGRSWLGTRKVVEWLGIAPELIVTANGATIMSRDDDAAEGYRRDTVETFDATEVLSQLERHLPEANFLVELGDGTRLYNNFVDDWDLSRSPASSSCPMTTPATSSRSSWSGWGCSRCPMRSVGRPGSTSRPRVSTNRRRSSRCASASAWILGA